MAQQLGRNRYRRELVAELDALFPPSLFRGLPRHGNEDWDPRKVVWMSLIMFWLLGKTLEEPFSAARRIVKFIRPQWNAPVSYSRVRRSKSASFLGGERSTRNSRRSATHAARQVRKVPGEALPHLANRQLPAERPQNDPRLGQKEERSAAQTPENPNSHQEGNPESQTTWLQSITHLTNGVACHPDARPFLKPSSEPPGGICGLRSPAAPP